MSSEYCPTSRSSLVARRGRYRDHTPSALLLGKRSTLLAVDSREMVPLICRVTGALTWQGKSVGLHRLKFMQSIRRTNVTG